MLRARTVGTTSLLATVACLASAAPVPAHAATTRACGREVVAASPLGGFGLILQDLRVRGVTCARGEVIAARSIVGKRTAGWRCGTSATGLVTCRRSSGALVRFRFGGDAG